MSDKKKQRRQGLQLDEEMKEISDRICDETGMTRTEVVRRLLRFADELDDVMRYEVLGTLPGSLRSNDFIEFLQNRMKQPAPKIAAKRPGRDNQI